MKKVLVSVTKKESIYKKEYGGISLSVCWSLIDSETVWPIIMKIDEYT